MTAPLAALSSAITHPVPGVGIATERAEMVTGLDINTAENSGAFCCVTITSIALAIAVCDPLVGGWFTVIVAPFGDVPFDVEIGGQALLTLSL